MDNLTPTSLEQRQQLLSAFPCFQSLTTNQSQRLATLLQEMTVTKGQTIVSEGEVVDAVYIIVEGEAEVSISHEYKKKRSQVPVAMLTKGEAIGLNDTGFFSSTGCRTATVIALTDMMLLRLSLDDLNNFLQQNNLVDSLYTASKQMLRMQFIKHSLPFSKISNERLQWLAEHVYEMTVPAGKEIFHEGDAGDNCYFIHKGQIEIYITENGQDKQLALLKPPVLFGEATFISHGRRNATARALEDTELLVLSHENLAEVIESETSVAAMFMTLTIDRSRPQKIDNVSIHERLSADGHEITILKNVANGKYFKLSKEGFFIWQQLDGTHTLQDITMDLAATHNVFAPDLVAGLIAKLNRNGFISNIDTYEYMNANKLPLWARAMNKLRSVLEFRYAFGDADRFITNTYQKGVRILFTKYAQWLLVCFAAFGLVAFIMSTGEVLDFFARHHLSFFLLFTLIPLSIVETMFHELGHAYAVKACGREVHYIGVGWYWFTPIAFTDTSDMWLASRRARMYVNIAGIYVDILIAGCATLGIYTFNNHYLQCVCWLFALYTYIGAIRMLSPLQEMDGYYILMDWVEKNRLRQSAVLWLAKKFPRCLKQPRLFKNYWPEVLYWLSCIAYIIIISCLTYMLQSFVFAILGMPSNPYLAFILPFLVVIFSCFNVLAEIKSRVEE